MKRIDLYLLVLVIAFFAPFILSKTVFNAYIEFNAAHGMITSFVKFGILATLGEVIGLRIKIGTYYQKGFGILPRAIVWGFLGLTIKLAFVIFAVGTPAFLAYLGMLEAPLLMAQQSFSTDKLLVAFSISLAMNLIYAPVMMTMHKITDMHIIENNGTLQGFFKPISVGKYFVNLNWDVQWNFVFKKTIPFFWIPAHTITFMLPPDFQVLFAALLGIALGVILAIAANKD